MAASLPVSIFNDVIGPVMRGPSSSHCAAALRIGRLARDLMGQEFDEVLVEFDRSGSLPTTHESQGSDMGLFGGLLGFAAVAGAKRLRAFRTSFLTNSKADPWKLLVPDLVVRLTTPPLKRPNSAGGLLLSILNS